jgi:hypothetical protein
MKTFIRLATASLAVLSACGRTSALDEQMKEDLQAASASTMEMAPAAGGMRTVSAIEQTGKVRPEVTKSRKATVPAGTPRPETPQIAQKSAEPAATVPLSRPAVSPPPPGGYKTMGEVLRNAPFPIKP